MLNVLAIVGGINVCSDLGIMSPLCLLEKRGEVSFKLTVASAVKNSEIRKADIIIFQRNGEMLDRLIFEFAQRLQKKIIFDIDDYLLELPKYLGKLADYHNAPERVTNLKYFLNKADVVKAGSPALANALKPYAKNIVVFSYPNVEEYYRPIRHSMDGILRFVVMISPDMLIFLNTGLLKVIERILSEYRGRVKFIFLGIDETFSFDDVDVECYPRMPFFEYIKFFSTLIADAGLVYLADDFFTRCKTNNKFREFAARGIAGIYNDISVYADCVISGKTGVVVQGAPQEYYFAIKNFLDNADSAKKIGQYARVFAEENYRLDYYANDWLKAIQHICSQRKGRLGIFYQLVLSVQFYFTRRMSNEFFRYKNFVINLFYIYRNQGFPAVRNRITKVIKKKIFE